MRKHTAVQTFALHPVNLTIRIQLALVKIKNQFNLT